MGSVSIAQAEGCAGGVADRDMCIAICTSAGTTPHIHVVDFAIVLSYTVTAHSNVLLARLSKQ